MPHTWPTAAALAWLAPAWALGLIAVAAVVAIHLWSRRAGPPVRFPSVRLIVAAERQQVRRQRLRDWLLLTLRCLIVALIVAAFAQPVWRTPAVGDAALGDQVDGRVVILIDDSASMSRAVGGRTHFDRALARADELANQIRGAASVRVVRASEANQADRTAPPDAATASAGAAGPTLSRVDLARVIRRLAAEADVIHVFTDGQATAFGGASELDLKTRLAPLKATLHFHPIRPADAVAANLALTAPRLTGLDAAVGASVRLTYDVINFSDQTAATDLIVEAGGDSQSIPLRLDPGQRASVTIALRPQRTGPLRIDARLTDGGWPLDDRNAITLSIGPRPHALLISPDDADDASTLTYFLARALAIEYEVHAVGSVDVSEALADLARPAALICVAGPTDGAAGGALVEAIESGAGALLIGPEATADFQNLSPIAARDPGQKLTSLAGLDFGSPPWRSLSDRSAEVRRMRFAAPGSTVATAEAAVLGVFEHGGPALAWRDVGRGRLMAWSGKFSTDHARSPLFAPLILSWSHLTRDARPRGPATVHPGETVTLTVSPDAPAPLTVRGPDGEAIAATTSDRGGSRTLMMEPVDRLGRYEIRDASGDFVSAVSVTLDPLESDLRPIALPEQPLRAEDDAAVDAAATGGADEEAEAARYEQTALWPGVLGVVLALVAMESIVAARGGRADRAARQSGDRFIPTESPASTARERAA